MLLKITNADLAIFARPNFVSVYILGLAGSRPAGPFCFWGTSVFAVVLPQLLCSYSLTTAFFIIGGNNASAISFAIWWWPSMFVFAIAACGTITMAHLCCASELMSCDMGLFGELSDF